MGSMMKNMTIGPKFILSISAVALLVITVGLVVLYQQEEAKMDTMLSGRSSVISTQIMIGRAYITQNYVAKIKKSKAGADMQVLKDHTGVSDAIPFPATAVREMGEEASRTGLYSARLVSQNPMNPANTPKDNFESEAIRAIMAGAEIIPDAMTSMGCRHFAARLPIKLVCSLPELPYQQPSRRHARHAEPVASHG